MKDRNKLVGYSNRLVFIKYFLVIYLHVSGGRVARGRPEYNCDFIKIRKLNLNK